MTINELMNKVKNELEARGFDVNSADGYTHQAYADKDGKSERRPYKEGATYTLLYGYQVCFNVVHRHNGTAENQSVDVRVMKWNASSGGPIATERVNTKMSDRAIANRINKIAEIFATL